MNQKPRKHSLVVLYWGDGKTVRELAQIWEASHSQVISWFEDYDIPRRGSDTVTEWPFGGDVDDAVRLLRRRPDLIIRLHIGGKVDSYKLVNDDDEFHIYRKNSNVTNVDPEGEYLASMFDSYEPQLCYRSEYDGL